MVAATERSQGHSGSRSSAVTTSVSARYRRTAMCSPPATTEVATAAACPCSGVVRDARDDEHRAQGSERAGGPREGFAGPFVTATQPRAEQRRGRHVGGVDDHPPDDEVVRPATAGREEHRGRDQDERRQQQAAAAQAARLRRRPARRGRGRQHDRRGEGGQRRPSGAAERGREHPEPHALQDRAERDRRPLKRGSREHRRSSSPCRRGRRGPPTAPRRHRGARRTPPSSPAPASAGRSWPAPRAATGR